MEEFQRGVIILFVLRGVVFLLGQSAHVIGSTERANKWESHG
jgi:hypothetical protein